jgi:hypothetical protein
MTPPYSKPVTRLAAVEDPRVERTSSFQDKSDAAPVR